MDENVIGVIVVGAAVSTMSLFVVIAITNDWMVFDAWQMELKLSKCVIHFTIAVKPLVRIKSNGFNRIESKYSVCKTNTSRTLSLSIKRLPSIYSNLDHKTWRNRNARA